MLEGILQLLGQEIQLIFQMGLRVSRDKFYVSIRIILDASLLLISFFVFLEKLRELLIILKLLFFHWYDLVDMCLEILKVVHENFLVSNKVIDVCRVLS